MSERLWRVEFSKDAAAEFRKLDRTVQSRILKFLRTRIASSDNPRRLGKRLSGDLSNLWRYRVGDYRLLVSIEDKVLLVLVVAVGPRGDIYRRP